MSHQAPAHPELLADIDKFCVESGMSRSAFGDKAMNDPRFVFDLEAGRELRRKSKQRVEDFMRTAAEESRIAASSDQEGAA